MISASGCAAAQARQQVGQRGASFLAGRTMLRRFKMWAPRVTVDNSVQPNC